MMLSKLPNPKFYESSFWKVVGIVLAALGVELKYDHTASLRQFPCCFIAVK